MQSNLFTSTDFYPTPQALISRMLDDIPYRSMQYFLEPSAGKGNILDYLRIMTKSNHPDAEFDCIEIDEELQHILRGKEYRVIADDFLQFHTHKRYDLIIANFPFSSGSKHLDQALNLLASNGGWLVCLVNAETIRNPRTMLEMSLVRSLEAFNASIEYIENAFADSERKTGVEVALIKVEHKIDLQESLILNTLKRGEAQAIPDISATALVGTADFKSTLLTRFKLECSAGKRLITEYFSLRPYLSENIARPNETASSGKLIDISIRDVKRSDNLNENINGYIKNVRKKFWALLIRDPRFRNHYTTNILNELETKLIELRDYDFDEFNIEALEKELRAKISSSVESAILAMFDEFSKKYAWNEDIHNGNVHYYNGWASNKAWKVNQKIVLPINGIRASYNNKWNFEYYIQDKLHDIVKVFNYLAADRISDIPLLVTQQRDAAEAAQAFKLDLRYFDITFYKKGTAHVKFKDRALLDKFNIFGSQRRGWLPPAYARKSYDEMSQDEQTVIDEFQGREAYEKVIKNRDYYIVTTDRLFLTGES